MSMSWVHTSHAQKLVVGPGAVRALPELMRELGARRVLLVTTRGRADAEAGDAVRAALGRLLVATFDGVEAGVPATAVQQAVRALRGEQVDAVVSLGGGAVIDTAKALAFFHEHESGAPAAGFADRPLLPHVAVPTTLVGAAYTGGFSMFDPGTRRSTTAGATTLVPVGVVADAALLGDLDGDLYRSSIAAALAHGIDTLWAGDRTPEVEAIAIAGVSRLAEWGPSSTAAPDDTELRLAVLDGAVLTGRARQHVGDGLLHALAQLVSSRTGAPYGLVVAAILPSIVAFTAEALGETARILARSLGDADGDPAELVRELLDDLGATVGLESLGVDDDDLDAVARQSQAQRGVQTHPRPMGEADVRALLDDAW
jgi:maleylacetate reductase